MNASEQDAVGVHDGRARELGLDEETRGTMLERLEAADRDPELHARLQVVERHRERRRHSADHLRAEPGRAGVDHALEQAKPALRCAEARVA
jgi:hypothetical protein